ncbi:claudin-34 [Nycticebus coucang]|uniref:claudin-34 n=1 Tax=Nycticebus coucang TaxID=9470 RepID=UPI00234C577D|nr:claudin-34 [Nycticebus coucang]
MLLLVNSANCQVAGFALITVGWLLSATSMGLAEWRVWHVDNASSFPPGIACVGMWRVCVYHHSSNIRKAKFCHRYTILDDFLPADIHLSQYLLLTATILGLLGRGFLILALRNVYLGIVQKHDINSPFIISGILSIIASICITVAVLHNYNCIRHLRGIAFPPSFRLPFKPDSQEAGSAALVASLGAFLMLLSGIFSLFYTFPLDSQVHPMAWEP